MSHYRTNLRDIEFNLFEVLNIDDHFGVGPFAMMDGDTARHVLVEIDRLAREEFAASFVATDRAPLELRDGEIALPPELHDSLDAFYEGDWHLLPLPPHLGGYGAPPTLIRAAQELLLGANPTAYFYLIGSLMARVIDGVGTEDQARTWARWMVERKWGGTMVLTEPDAGSDVGSGTTRAIDAGDGTWRLEGVKRFITSGEHDYAENIVHLVLARREGGPPGTKGLSMFIVPKYLVDEHGNPARRNGVVCTGLEKKMGIKGSTTCELSFGMDEPAVGYLVGGVHEGIRQMFHVIEDARMLTGIKSAATLSTAYLNALEYAKERVQGRDLTALTDPSSPRVPIFDHPDVKRMLTAQKAHAEGLRALCCYAAWVQDQAQLHPEDEYWRKLDDLLLPLVKGYSSEKTYELLAYSLQVLGGSGYTTDYPMEQYIRDAKIDTLYEGTTGIQALDLFFRKVARDQGATLSRFAGKMLEAVKGGGDGDPLAAEREQLGRSIEDVQAQIGRMVGWLLASRQEPAEIYKVGLHANSLLEGLAEVVIGWLLLRHAEIAGAARPAAEPADVGFYTGKIAAARWFIATVLPKSELRRKLTEREDGTLMDLDDAAA